MLVLPGMPWMHSYEYLPSTCPVPGSAQSLRAGRHRGLSQTSLH